MVTCWRLHHLLMVTPKVTLALEHPTGRSGLKVAYVLYVHILLTAPKCKGVGHRVPAGSSFPLPALP